MAQYHLIQAVFLLVSTCISIGVFILDCMMFSHVRRQRLPQFKAWLIPATLSAAVAVIIYLTEDVRQILGFRQTLASYELTAISSALAYALTGWASIRLWGMISRLPYNSQVNDGLAPQYQEPGTWPPPPNI